MATYPLLRDIDIVNNKFMYDIDTIEWNIQHSFLSLRLLLRNQHLTPYICAKYIVFGGRNGAYADCCEDSWISIGEVLNYQRHITLEDMVEARKIVNRKIVNEEYKREENERKKMEEEELCV
jgi:hypothetical protein